MGSYTVPAGATVEVKPVVGGAWAPHLTTAVGVFDEYLPTTDGRFWVFIRDGWAMRVEPHRVGRDRKHRPPKSRKPKAKRKRPRKAKLTPHAPAGRG